MKLRINDYNIPYERVRGSDDDYRRNMGLLCASGNELELRLRMIDE